MQDSDPVTPTAGAMRRVFDATRAYEKTGASQRGRGTRPPQPGGVSAGGSGGKVVVFTIDSFDDTTGIAVCTIEYRPYGDSMVNGESQYGTIDVIDPAGCFFNEAEADLIGRWGTASYMMPTAANDPYLAAVWVVIGLCCPAA